MASSANVMYQAGYIVDGFYQALVITPTTPVVIDIGEVGNPLNALPFRTKGGSVLDLDLLYGLLGDAANLDVQPLFFLATRTGVIRVFGQEIPRQVILDEVIEARATLLAVEDFVVEGNPTGSNLFGSVGLTTRPMNRVTLDNTDGYWTALDERELLLGCPAGFFWDLAHQVLMPELVGVVSAVTNDGDITHITFGHVARQTTAPNIVE